MAISHQEVTHVARLARLRLSETELVQMREQLSNILDYIAMLQEVELTGVPPTAQVLDSTTVLRPDNVTEKLERDMALSNAPDSRDGMFRVQAVFDT